MKKKIVGSIICTLLITMTIVPCATASVLNTVYSHENLKVVSDDHPKVVANLPAVHIYSVKPLSDWGFVAFDTPGAVIDVDVSGVEGNLFDLKISQSVICHVQNQKFPVLVIYDIQGWSTQSAPIFKYMNWTETITNGYLPLHKNVSNYPLKIWITAVPSIFTMFLTFYWMLHMWFWKLPMEPSGIEARHGISAEYQLHFIT